MSEPRTTHGAVAKQHTPFVAPYCLFSVLNWWPGAGLGGCEAFVTPTFTGASVAGAGSTVASGMSMVSPNVLPVLLIDRIYEERRHVKIFLFFAVFFFYFSPAMHLSFYLCTEPQEMRRT